MDSNQKNKQLEQGSEIDDQKAIPLTKNPNIGGDESEYETSTSDAEHYAEEAIADNTEGFANRRDTEEIDRHIDQTRYNRRNENTLSEE